MEPTDVKTTIGPVRLGLRAYAYKPSLKRYLYDASSSIWMHFNKSDLDRSQAVLSDSRALAFELWVPSGTEEDFQIYIGRDLTSWDEKLAIRLECRDRRIVDGRSWDIWWAEYDDEDVARLRTEYWCAAQARVTICRGPRAPLARDRDGTVATVVSLGYSGVFEALYENVLEDLSKSSIPGHLAAPFERYMDFAKRDPGDTLAYALYKRLRLIAADLEQVARSIDARPDRTLVPRLGYQQMSAEAASVYLRNRAGQIDIGRLDSAIERDGSVIPTAFTEIAPAFDLNTPSNGHAAHAFRRVIQALELVATHLEQEEKSSPEAVPQHGEALSWLSRTKRQFRRYHRRLAHTNQWPSVSPSFDQRYAALRRLTDTLDYVLGYVDGNTVPFEVQAFWQLYERWTFLQVVLALQTLGFRIRGRRQRTTEFYRHPVPNKVNCEMRHPDLPDMTLEVWFGKKYPSMVSNTDYYDADRPYGLEKRYGRTSYSGWKDWPDIALEFHSDSSSSSPLIIILDPTLRGRRPPPSGPTDKVEDKYEYLDAIRSFVDTDEKNHSQRLVRASWGVSPTFQGDQPFMLEVPGDYSRGFVHLRPGDGSEGHMVVALRQILVGTGLMAGQ